MRWFRRCLLAGAMASLGLASPALAQAVPPVIAAPADLSQDQRGRADERQRELQRIAPPDGDVQIRSPVQAPRASGACIGIRRIAVEGAAHLPADQQKALMTPFVGRCLSLADLDRIINALNAAYIDRGLVTSRAYLPEQNLAAGTLRVVVVEGSIAGFLFKGVDADHHVLAAFPGLKGGVLNLRDIEQGFDQMSRLPSWDARLHIAPGPASGSSVVVVEANTEGWLPTGWLHGQLWLDNNGQADTGRDVGHIQLRADDPLGRLDLWTVEYDRTLFSLRESPESSYASGDFSLPFGYWTVFADWRYSDYAYAVHGLADTYRLNGDTSTWKLGLSRVLTRDQVSKTTFEASYTLEQVRSYLDQVRLDTATETLASLSQRLSYSRKMLGGAWYVTLGLREGLGTLGTSNVIAHPGNGTPHAAYLKPSLDIDGYQPLPLKAQWHVSLHAEYADATQYGADALQIGGQYTVRGFLDNSLIGDHGAYIRNDIGWTLPQTGIKFLDKVSGPVDAYILLDAGWAEQQAPTSSAGRGAIAGAGLGLRSTAGPLFWDISLQHDLTRGPLPDEGWITAWQVGIKF